MRVKYEFDIHLYKNQEKLLPNGVEAYNIEYVLKITKFEKRATRWYFTVEGDFPKDLTQEEIEKMKRDTIFRIGWWL